MAYHSNKNGDISQNYIRMNILDILFRFSLLFGKFRLLIFFSVKSVYIFEL